MLFIAVMLMNKHWQCHSLTLYFAMCNKYMSSCSLVLNCSTASIKKFKQKQLVATAPTWKLIYTLLAVNCMHNDSTQIFGRRHFLTTDGRPAGRNNDEKVPHRPTNSTETARCYHTELQVNIVRKRKSEACVYYVENTGAEPYHLHIRNEIRIKNSQINTPLAVNITAYENSWASSVSFSTSHTSRQMSHWRVHCEQISRSWNLEIPVKSQSRSFEVVPFDRLSVVSC